MKTAVWLEKSCQISLICEGRIPRAERRGTVKHLNSERTSPLVTLFPVEIFEVPFLRGLGRSPESKGEHFIFSPNASISINCNGITALLTALRVLCVRFLFLDFLLDWDRWQVAGDARRVRVAFGCPDRATNRQCHRVRA